MATGGLSANRLMQALAIIAGIVVHASMAAAVFHNPLDKAAMWVLIGGLFVFLLLTGTLPGAWQAYYTSRSFDGTHPES